MRGERQLTRGAEGQARTEKRGQIRDGGRDGEESIWEDEERRDRRDKGVKEEGREGEKE